MLRHVLLLLAMLVASIPLTACGEGEERAVPPPPEPDPSATTATPVRTASGEESDRPDLRTLAERWARQRGLNPAFVRALISVESGWNPKAISPDGARGLTQMMPGTAREEFGLTDPSRLLDPETNLRLGTDHLRALFEKFCATRLALWAWHAGRKRVDRAAERITPAESQRFVRSVLSRYQGQEDEATRAPGVTYPKANCPDRVKVAGVSPPDTTPEQSERVRMKVYRSPKAEVTHAWLSGRRVRVGEPVNLRIEATNKGGEAETGEIAVTLRQHPEVRLGYRSDLSATFRSEGRVPLDSRSAFGAGQPVVRARTSPWKHGEIHSLYLRIVPESTGRIVLAYRVRLKDGGSGFGSRDAEAAGRTVAIEITETLAGGNR